MTEELNRRHNLATMPTINNNGESYIVPFDIYKEGYDAYDISNWFKGRVGDNGTPFGIRWYKHGQLMDVTGMRPFIEGQVGDYTIDDSDPDDPKINMDSEASNVHVVGEVNDCQEYGVAIYRLINQAMPQSGIFYGKIGFMGTQDDGTLVNTGVDIVFKVLAGHMNMLGARKFYVTELEKAWLEMQAKFKQYNQEYKDTTTKQAEQFKAETEKALADLKTKIENEVQRAEDTLGNTQSAIDANIASLKNLATEIASLQVKIQDEDLITLSQYEKSQQTLNDTVANQLAQITTIPEVFSSLDELQKTYPKGKPGLFYTTDNNQKYYWKNNQWIDGGDFETAHLASYSINPDFLTASAQTLHYQNGRYPLIWNASDRSITVPEGSQITVTNGRSLKYILPTGKCLLNFGKETDGLVYWFPNKTAETQFELHKNVSDVPDTAGYIIGYINLHRSDNKHNITYFDFVIPLIQQEDIFMGAVDAPSTNEIPMYRTPQRRAEIKSDYPWNIDYDSQTIYVPQGHVVYKNKVFSLPAGPIKVEVTESAKDHPNKGFLRMHLPHFNVENDKISLQLVNDYENDLVEQAPYIGYVDFDSKVFMITDQYNSFQYQKPYIINSSQQGVTVDFNKKTINFPLINHLNVGLNPRFDFQVNPVQLNLLENSASYFGFNPGKAKFDVGDHAERAIEIKPNIADLAGDVFLGWVDPSTNHYDFTASGLGSSIADSYVKKTWNGKAITCIGDSFTHGPAGHPDVINYVSRMQPYLGTMPTNKGVGGATLASGNAGREYIGDQINGVTNQDVITIFGGTNDFAAGSQIGSMSDSTDTHNTVIGSLKYMITTLAKQNPDAKFLLITPAKATANGWATYNSDGTEAKNSAGFTAAQYVKAIKDVGSYYSIPVLDIFTAGNFNPILNPNLSLEGLHPNNEGFARLAQTIADKINEL